MQKCALVKTFYFIDKINRNRYTYNSRRKRKQASDKKLCKSELETHGTIVFRACVTAFVFKMFYYVAAGIHGCTKEKHSRKGCQKPVSFCVCHREFTPAEYLPEQSFLQSSHSPFKTEPEQSSVKPCSSDR